MHIVLGLLGFIVTILVLLSRLADAGIDLGGLNPYLWSRRRKWRKKYNGDPVFKIDNPMDATAILIVAVCKADGDISREDKKLVLDIFQNEFKLSKKDAIGLFISSAHVLGDGALVRSSIARFLSSSKENFSEIQVSSCLALLKRVSHSAPGNSGSAVELLRQVETELQSSPVNNQTW